jgi:signal-transduction protein with cAMP-binding, CBS, and nucleotidyltransferase domain
MVKHPPSDISIASLSKMNEIQTIAQHVETKTNYLMMLKDGIERMPVVHQVEVLRILTGKSVNINENKNGIFINITKLNDETLAQLDEYMKYVIKQEEQLSEVEHQKELITKEYFDCKA